MPRGGLPGCAMDGRWARRFAGIATRIRDLAAGRFHPLPLERRIRKSRRLLGSGDSRRVPAEVALESPDLDRRRDRQQEWWARTEHDGVSDCDRREDPRRSARDHGPSQRFQQFRLDCFRYGHGSTTSIGTTIGHIRRSACVDSRKGSAAYVRRLWRGTRRRRLRSKPGRSTTRRSSEP